MSGLEVSGLVLGAIPLLISALEHYKSGRGAVATFMKFHGQLDTLIYRLKLQKTFFYLNILDLLRNAGVEEAMNTDLSEEDCIRILRNAKSSNEVQEYLGTRHLYETFIEILSRYETCLKTIAGKLDHINRPPKAAKDDLQAILAANPHKGSAFCFGARLSFSIEKGSLKQLVEELSEERLSLKVIIESIKTQQEYTSKHPSAEAMRLADKLAAVQRQAAPLFEAMRKGCTCDCESKPKIFMRLDNRVLLRQERLATGNKHTEFNLIFDLKDHRQDALVNVHKQNVDQDCGKPATTTVTFAQGVTHNLSGRVAVTHICRHVVAARGAGHVLKLELSDGRLGLVEGSGQGGRDFSAPTTLDEILKSGCQDEDAKMFPQEQALLALNIASSILQLHQTYWLSLPFNSRMIKMFAHQETNPTLPISLPFIEQRAAEPCSESLGHPAKLGGTIGPDPKTALTELAILFLEIWHQRPLEVWCEKAGKGSPESPEARMMTAIQWLQATSRRLLPFQLQVIEQCLQVCAGSLRYWHERDFLRLYCENIIRPLQEGYQAWGS